jgi:hypothetical protein
MGGLYVIGFLVVFVVVLRLTWRVTDAASRPFAAAHDRWARRKTAEIIRRYPGGERYAGTMKLVSALTAIASLILWFTTTGVASYLFFLFLPVACAFVFQLGVAYEHRTRDEANERLSHGSGATTRTPDSAVRPSGGQQAQCQRCQSHYALKEPFCPVCGLRLKPGYDSLAFAGSAREANWRRSHPDAYLAWEHAHEVEGRP